MFKANDRLILAKVSEAVHEDAPTMLPDVKLASEVSYDHSLRLMKMTHAPWRKTDD